jgi:hypothetical protein
MGRYPKEKAAVLDLNDLRGKSPPRTASSLEDLKDSDEGQKSELTPFPTLISKMEKKKLAVP